MTKRRPVVEIRRGLYRKDPLRLLLDQESGDERAACEREGRRCPELEALNLALASYAAVVGWPEARTWLAARSHEKPGGRRRAA